MQRIQYDLKRFEKQQEDKKVCATRWQDYALKVCNDFNISKKYHQLIFRKAKTNIGFLEHKVALCTEKFGDVSNKGRYLISLFRKKPPWEEK